MAKGKDVYREIVGLVSEEMKNQEKYKLKVYDDGFKKNSLDFWGVPEEIAIGDSEDYIIPAGWRKSILGYHKLEKLDIPWYFLEEEFGRSMFYGDVRDCGVIHMDFTDIEEEYFKKLHVKKSTGFRSKHRKDLLDEEIVEKDYRFTDLTKKQLEEFKIPYFEYEKARYVLGKNKFEVKKYGRIIHYFYWDLEDKVEKLLENRKIKRFIESLCKLTGCSVKLAHTIAYAKIEHKEDRLNWWYRNSKNFEGLEYKSRKKFFDNYKKLEPLRIIKSKEHAKKIIEMHEEVERIKEEKRQEREKHGDYYWRIEK